MYNLKDIIGEAMRELTWYIRKHLFRTEESNDGDIEEQKRQEI